jgi:hypothetical protein
VSKKPRYSPSDLPETLPFDSQPVSLHLSVTEPSQDCHEVVPPPFRVEETQLSQVLCDVKRQTKDVKDQQSLNDKVRQQEKVVKEFQEALVTCQEKLQVIQRKIDEETKKAAGLMQEEETINRAKNAASKVLQSMKAEVWEVENALHDNRAACLIRLLTWRTLCKSWLKKEERRIELGNLCGTFQEFPARPTAMVQIEQTPDRWSTILDSNPEGSETYKSKAQMMSDIVTFDQNVKY